MFELTLAFMVLLLLNCSKTENPVSTEDPVTLISDSIIGVWTYDSTIIDPKFQDVRRLDSMNFMANGTYFITEREYRGDDGILPLTEEGTVWGNFEVLGEGFLRLYDNFQLSVRYTQKSEYPQFNMTMRYEIAGDSLIIWDFFKGAHSFFLGVWEGSSDTLVGTWKTFVNDSSTLVFQEGGFLIGSFNDLGASPFDRSGFTDNDTSLTFHDSTFTEDRVFASAYSYERMYKIKNGKLYLWPPPERPELIGKKQ